MISSVVTIPPYAPFIKEVVRHSIVFGLRLNTVMPVKEPLEEVLKRLKDLAEDKTLWIDLKGRQLRTIGYATPPFTEVRVSHEIEVDTPVTVYFGNGREYAKLVGVDGNRLMFLEGPQRVVGPGESINIPDPSLVIHGYLTKTDLKYIEAAKNVGIHDYMLSFVESRKDLEELLKYDSDSRIIAKIESLKGLEYVKKDYNGECGLMAARGDLFIEVNRPHEILEAIETIIEKDKEAIVASRIFSSLATSLIPDCSDISDIAYLKNIGYKTFMLGDEVCLRRESVMSALNLMESIIESKAYAK